MNATIVKNPFVVLPAAGWIAAISFILTASLDPRWYFHYSTEQPTPFVYPSGSVALVVGVTTMEIAAFFVVVRPWRRPVSILRLAIALCLLGGWAALCTPFVLHMPGYVLVHHVWLLALTAFVGCATAVAGLTRLTRGFSGPRPVLH